MLLKFFAVVFMSHKSVYVFLTLPFPFFPSYHVLYISAIAFSVWLCDFPCIQIMLISVGFVLSLGQETWTLHYVDSALTDCKTKEC